MSNIKNKKYIQKVCGVVYRQFIKKENIDINQMADYRPTYEYIFSFLQKSLGHNDDETDFLYACAYLNIAKWGDKILTINPEQITIVPKQKFKGARSYVARVRYDEYYSYETYMDIMLEYMIDEYQIDEDSIDTDIIDTWDHEIDIYVDRNSKR